MSVFIQGPTYGSKPLAGVKVGDGSSYTLFLNGHASCAGTLAYCKSAARRPLSRSTVYIWEIRDAANQVVAQCVVRGRERMKWETLATPAGREGE